MRRRWILIWLGIWLLLAPQMILRQQWEEENRTVSLYFDAGMLETLADASEQTPEQWARTLRQAGLTGLALREETLERLQNRGKLIWQTKKQALAEPGWTELYAAQVRTWLTGQGKGVLVTLWEQETADWLTDSLTRRERQFTRVSGANGVIWLLIEGEETLAQLPLGCWPETAALADQTGLSCAVVLELPEEEDTAALADALYAEWERLGVKLVICAGGALPGWSESEETARQLLEDYTAAGGALALTETSQQRGSLDFPGKEAVLERQGSLLRCFYQWDYVSNRYGALGYTDGREVSMALSRAAAERGCRVLWLTAMMDSESGERIENRDDYVCLLRQLDADLTRFGLEAGDAQPGRAVSGLPKMAACLLGWWTATGTGCLCAWMLVRGRRGWRGLLLCQFTALTGGLAASVWMSSSDFYLGEAWFRGVKLAQLIPAACFLLFWARRQTREHRDALRRWRERPVTGNTLIWTAAAEAGLLLLAGIGVYYVARTGNSGLAADAELRLRNLLEEWLTVRPRFKEFALGLPCLALWMWGKLPWQAELPVGLGAMIGLVSVVNTFLHLYTPLRISFIRTGAGWLLGTGAALLALGILRAGRRLRWPEF